MIIELYQVNVRVQLGHWGPQAHSLSNAGAVHQAHPDCGTCMSEGPSFVKFSINEERS